MAARKTQGNRGKLILAERRTRVAKLWKFGWTQSEIAAEVKVTQSMVSRDIKALIEEEKQNARVDIAAVKALAHARYEMILKENMAAYERSVGERETKTLRVKDQDSPDATDKTLRVETTAGDPRFLKNAESVVDRIVDLHQAGGPKQLNINDISKRPTDQLLDRLSSLIPGAVELLRTSGGGSDPSGAGAKADSTSAGGSEQDESEAGQ